MEPKGYIPDGVVVYLDVHPGYNPDQVVLDHAVSRAKAITEETRHPNVVQCSLLLACMHANYVIKFRKMDVVVRLIKKKVLVIYY
jgi:hypothetical protein